MIGGWSSDDGNVISANSQAGVELSGLYSTQNTIGNNFIGTDIGGTLRPGANSATSSTTPLQMYGVFIATPSPSLPAGTTNNVLANNVISGNQVGVNITGQGSGNSGSGTAQGVPFGQNVLVGNMIGTDSTGLAADPNFEYGVYIDNSAGNTIGGTGAGQAEYYLGQRHRRRRDLRRNNSDKRVREVRSESAAAANIIINNLIGVDTERQTFIRHRRKLGSDSGRAANYSRRATVWRRRHRIVRQRHRRPGRGQPIHRRQHDRRCLHHTPGLPGQYFLDSNQAILSLPTTSSTTGSMACTVTRHRTIRLPNRPRASANQFAGNPINLEDFIQSVNKNNTLPNPKSKYPLPKQHKAATVKRTVRPKVHVVTPAHKPKAVTPTSVRPRVPALFHAGKKSIVVAHVPAHPHR